MTAPAVPYSIGSATTPWVAPRLRRGTAARSARCGPAFDRPSSGPRRRSHGGPSRTPVLADPTANACGAVRRPPRRSRPAPPGTVMDLVRAVLQPADALLPVAPQPRVHALTADPIPARHLGHRNTGQHFQHDPVSLLGHASSRGMSGSVKRQVKPRCQPSAGVGHVDGRCGWAPCGWACGWAPVDGPWMGLGWACPVTTFSTGSRARLRHAGAGRSPAPPQEGASWPSTKARTETGSSTRPMVASGKSRGLSVPGASA